MNKHKLLKAVLFSFFVIPVLHSQNKLQLNEDFLNSLPEETRDQLLTQLEEDQQDLEEVNYGVVSTMLQKTPAQRYIEQELLKKEGRDIPSQYLKLEQLKIFGSDFFSGLSPSTFMPTSEPSLSGEYLLDIGDKLNIVLFGGSNDGVKNIIISQNGTISLPNIGAIQIAGLSIDDANERLNDYLKDKIPGISAAIELVDIRNIQVVVVGFVEKPGIYTLSGNSNILSALRAAGGITKNGSFRNIIIKRNGNILNEIDLYDVFVHGKLLSNTSLRSGDSVLISSSGSKVAIYGGISQPAIYEARNEETISDIIKFAGFGLNGRKINEVNLARLKSNARESLQINETSFNNYSIKDSDQIFVPFIKEAPFMGVSLLGAFLEPGVISLEQANKLNSRTFFTAKDAYTNTFFLKKANGLNNSFSYEAINPNQLPDFEASDVVIALSFEDISFLNSNTLNDFLSKNILPNELKQCKVFEYLSNIASTGRFQRSLLLFQPKLSKNYPKTSSPIDIANEVKNSETLPPFSKDLFEFSDMSKSVDFVCPRIFNDDPELLLAVLQNSILIDGPAIKGGIFPIYNSISLQQIIDGVSFISKISGNETISITSNEFSEELAFDDIAMKQIFIGSNITVSSPVTIASNAVKIEGEVTKPGTYFISSGDRLSSLISRAGGYTSNAYPVGGHLSRLTAKEFEENYNERLYNEIVKTLSSEIVNGGVVPFETISYILNEFKSISPSGRVIAEFNMPILRRDISKDIILEHGDSIFIPKKSNVVYVFGEVLNPGPQVFSVENDVNNYIASAGGFTRLVDKGSVILVYPDGKSKLIEPSILFGSNDDILPGSVIYASRDIRKLDNLSLASTLAPIVSSIAISLASLNSISNN